MSRPVAVLGLLLALACGGASGPAADVQASLDAAGVDCTASFGSDNLMIFCPDRLSLQPARGLLIRDCTSLRSAGMSAASLTVTIDGLDCFYQWSSAENESCSVAGFANPDVCPS